MSPRALRLAAAFLLVVALLFAGRWAAALVAELAVQVDGVPVRQHLRLGGLQVGLHREAGFRQVERVFPVAHVRAETVIL